MTFTETMKSDLLLTAKWSKFLAIVGFIGVGLLVVLSFLIMAGFSAFDSITHGDAAIAVFVGILYLLMGLLYIFPILYLLRFATNTKQAVLDNDEAAMEEALINQRKMYKFFGVLMIVALSIYALAALILIPVALFTAR